MQKVQRISSVFPSRAKNVGKNWSLSSITTSYSHKYSEHIQNGSETKAGASKTK